LPAGRVSEETDLPGYGFVVADGVGGNAGGEVASRMAITMLIECILRTPDWIMGHEEHHLAKVHERTAGRFQAVNEAVVTHSQSTPELRGMGTTLSLALSLGDDLLVGHVGDSPVCLFRSGQLLRLTRDHSLNRRYADANAASVSRFRRLLTRVIGMPQTGCEPDIFLYKLVDGDRLLLCSDGLTDMVDNELIAAELGKDTSAADTCQSLMDLSLDHGGRDNATVVIAAYRFPNGPERRQAE
jgi:protein phosphatase